MYKEYFLKEGYSEEVYQIVSDCAEGHDLILDWQDDHLILRDKYDSSEILADGLRGTDGVIQRAYDFLSVLLDTVLEDEESYEIEEFQEKVDNLVKSLDILRGV